MDIYSPLTKAQELAVAAYDAAGKAEQSTAARAFAAHYARLSPGAQDLLRADDLGAANLIDALAEGRPLTNDEKYRTSSVAARWKAIARGRSAPSSASGGRQRQQPGAGSRYRGRSSRYSKAWAEAARERHVREAQELSAELGGTDQDVKEFFFQLSPEELAPILDAYERENGAVPREYAEETIPQWRSGERRMSGKVAARLFRLLPPYMPLEAKYLLTKNLWNHVGPSSKQQVRIGRGASLDETLNVVRAHISNVVVHYKIPATLERRFEWLTAHDVQLRQVLLNRLRDEEVELVVNGIRDEFPVLQRHISGWEGNYTQRLARTVRIGKHELEMVFDRSLEGVQLGSPRATQPLLAREDIWRWAAAAAGALALLLLLLNAGD